MKYIFIAFGFLFLGIGAIGVFLPILPTTPFLLLASYCFTKGSNRFSQWFQSTKLYKKHLDSFVKSRSMTLKSKVGLLAFTTTMMMIGLIMTGNLAAKIIIGVLIIFKYYYFLFRIKTVPSGEAKQKQ